MRPTNKNELKQELRKHRPTNHIIVPPAANIESPEVRGTSRIKTAY